MTGQTYVPAAPAVKLPMEQTAIAHTGIRRATRASFGRRA